MDPYLLVDQAESQGRLPKQILSRIRARAKNVSGAVRRVEDASGLSYPPYFVEPVLPLARDGVAFGQMGVLYARVIPTTATGSLTVLIQFTGALVAFASKGTMEAVAAHEFTHYVDLIRRLSRTNVSSDERSTTLFETAYVDSEKTVAPKLIFKDRALVLLVNRKFKDGLADERLNEAVRKSWIEKNLPIRIVATNENVTRVDLSSVFSTTFDPKVLNLISSIEAKIKN